MTSDIRAYTVKTPVVVWCALVGATALSWYLGDSHGPARLATVAVLIVAFGKVYLVGRYFMELKDAPRLLHAVFGGWCIAMCSTLTAQYLMAT